jgi:hypothetical protein
VAAHRRARWVCQCCRRIVVVVIVECCAWKYKNLLGVKLASHRFRQQKFWRERHALPTFLPCSSSKNHGQKPSDEDDGRNVRRDIRSLGRHFCCGKISSAGQSKYLIASLDRHLLHFYSRAETRPRTGELGGSANAATASLSSSSWNVVLESTIGTIGSMVLYWYDSWSLSCVPIVVVGSPSRSTPWFTPHTGRRRHCNLFDL